MSGIDVMLRRKTLRAAACKLIAILKYNGNLRYTEFAILVKQVNPLLDDSVLRTARADLPHYFNKVLEEYPEVDRYLGEDPVDA